jgi:hypothetical protein
MTDQTNILWRKSSRSGGNGGQCVEIRVDLAAVRDSKNQDGPELRVDARTLVAFARSASK